MLMNPVYWNSIYTYISRRVQCSAYVPQVWQKSDSEFLSCPSVGVFESLLQWFWLRLRDWGHLNDKLSPTPSCSGRPEVVFSVDNCCKEVVIDWTDGSLGEIPAWLSSRFASSGVSLSGRRFPSRWSLLRFIRGFICEWCELLLFVISSPLHFGQEMLAKLLEGIWTTPQLAHSASTALP